MMKSKLRTVLALAISLVCLAGVTASSAVQQPALNPANLPREVVHYPPGDAPEYPDFDPDNAYWFLGGSYIPLGTATLDIPEDAVYDPDTGTWYILLAEDYLDLGTAILDSDVPPEP